MRRIEVHDSRQTLGSERAEAERHARMIHVKTSDVVETISQTRRRLRHRVEEQASGLDGAPGQHHGAAADGERESAVAADGGPGNPVIVPLGETISTAIAFVTTRTCSDVLTSRSESRVKAVAGPSCSSRVTSAPEDVRSGVRPVSGIGPWKSNGLMPHRFLARP